MGDLSNNSWVESYLEALVSVRKPTGQFTSSTEWQHVHGCG